MWNMDFSELVLVGAIIFWLLPTVLVVVVLGLARWWKGRTQSRRSDHPFCRRCGYDLHHCTGKSCPECGAELSVDAVVFPSLRRPAALWQKLVLAVALITTPILLSMLGLLLLLPSSHVHEMSVYAPGQGVVPQPTTPGVTLMITGDRRGNAGFEEVRFSVHNIETSRLRVFKISSQEAGGAQAVITPDRFREQLAEIAVSFNDAEVEEAHRLAMVRAVDHLLSGADPNQVGGLADRPQSVFIDTHFEPLVVAWVLAGVVALVVWLLSLRAVVHWQRRTMRRYYGVCQSRYAALYPG